MNFFISAHLYEWNSNIYRTQKKKKKKIEDIFIKLVHVLLLFSFGNPLTNVSDYLWQLYEIVAEKKERNRYRQPIKIYSRMSAL